MATREAENPMLIMAVRRGQAALAKLPGGGIQRYIERETWKAAAQRLAEHYFPRSLKQGNTAAIEITAELYLSALALYPLQFRLKGTYRPDWTRGTLLSWFRRSMGEATRQWWTGTIELTEAPTVEQAADNAARYLQVNDPEWITPALTYLHHASLLEGRVGALARLIYYPVAYAHIDAEWRKQTAFDALPHRRRILRTLHEGTVGYVRRGQTIWLVADRYAREKLPTVEWIDLREKTIDILDYRLSWTKDNGDQGVHIELLPSVLDKFRARAEVILVDGKAKPPYRLHQLNKATADFAALHQYATGAGRQLWDLDRHLFRQVREILMPSYPDAAQRFTSPNGKLYTAPVKPIPNLYLDPGTVSEATWRATFNPYR